METVIESARQKADIQRPCYQKHVESQLAVKEYI